jgi:putative transcriptional regulator
MSPLIGQLLVSMPQMQDPFFARSVVYICSHSNDVGAVGLIVNKTIDSLTIEKLYAQLKIESLTRSSRPQPVHFGGPVGTGRAFVLHSADYRDEGTLGLSDGFSMTATLDILRATGKGVGPRQSILALGYAGWGRGQLESEIKANGWLSVPADTGLVFNADNNSKWQRTLAKLGVSPELLSTDTGHA